MDRSAFRGSLSVRRAFKSVALLCAVSASQLVFGAQNPISSLVLAPATVAGGGTSTATVTLTSAAPAGGATVTISSSNTLWATAPTSVLVLAGQTSATFTVTSFIVPVVESVTMTAAYSTGTKTATLTVNPPTLTALSLLPTSVPVGTPSIGTVTLSGNAPSGGMSVGLTTSNTTATSVASSV